MKIEWKIRADQSPYLFRQYAEWTGLNIHRARVMPGKLLEHCDDFHKLSVAMSGHIVTEKLTISGKLRSFQGSSGDVCMTPAGQMMSADWNKPIDNLGIQITQELVAQTAIENCFTTNFEFRESQKDKDFLVQQIGLALLAESTSETPIGKLYTDSLIQTLSLHLLKDYSTASQRQENTNGGLSGYKLRRVKEFINANLENDLSLGELAKAVDLSQFHFARAFRKSTGVTPQNYLMQQRIERAKELLAKNELPIVEISLQTGFKNQSHFTTLFRKFTNFTPKHWRELKLA